MLYINEKHISDIGIDWKQLTDVICEAVLCLSNNDFSQPIKPYLRYGNMKNRIIAMPAYIGGKYNCSGIKWIASFPDNINYDIPRAHSVVILNDAHTGVPIATINTPLLSIIRTAAVSGTIIKYFDNCRERVNYNVGICGWGPIGQYHYKMCEALLGKRVLRYFLYDIRSIKREQIDFLDNDKICIVDKWEDAYLTSDIFITCTVAESPYIDKKPKNGALLLNVSLRDYKTCIYNFVKNSIIVDSWEEVCRENTDVENMFKEKNLKKENVKSIIDIICEGALSRYLPDEAIMVNPMGMSIFDIAISNYYYSKAKENNIGITLE